MSPAGPLTADAGGVYVIAPTPFDGAGAVDDSSIDRLVDFYASCGVAGITALGVMGEAPKLDTAESLAITKRIIGRADRLPVVIGVSAPGFAGMRALAQEAMALGAAGVMIAPPNTLRTDDQIVGYYRQAVQAIGAEVPFVIQDYPLVFSVVMTAEVIRRIVEENASCRMLKLEDWPSLEKVSALRAMEAAGRMRHLSILCGNGGIFLDYELERGVDGAMTGYAFTDMLCDLVRLSQAGEREAAHDLFDAHLPLMRYEQQPGVGLAVRKHLLMRRGLIGSEAQRAPAAGLSERARAEIDHLLKRLARHDARAALG